MEQEKIESTLELIKNKLQNYQHQHNHQNQLLKENSSSSSSCTANILVEKLIRIVQNEKKEKSVLESEFSTLSIKMELETETEARAKTGPEEKTMANSVVVREILSYMDAHSLLKLRAVSLLWKEEATSILMSSKHATFFCVRFEWWKYRGEFCSETTDSLSDFIQNFMSVILINSSIFPCSQFIFSGGSLNDPTLIKFFTEYGSHVQHLGLFPETPEMATLQNIVFKWTPNLKSLNLKKNLLELKIEETGSKNPDEQFPLLPNLRKIILPEPQSYDPRPQSPLLHQLLTSAPNLTSVEDPQLAYIPQITSAGKISLVNSLEWNFSSPLLDQNLLGFVSVRPRPKLKSFNLETAHTAGDPRILKAIRTLLQRGQNTLEDIKGVEELGQLIGPFHKLPPLLKVTELHLSARGPQDRNILPAGNALSAVLPNLKAMHLEVDWNGHYPLTAPLNAHSGVTKLKISPWDENSEFRFMFNLVKPLASMYPKITHLHLDLQKMGGQNVPTGFELIPWCFEELQDIKLEFRINEETPVGFKREMDSSLTGLPWELCEQLWSSREPDEEYQKLEVLDGIRTAPSIFDLKKLTNLTFLVHFEKHPAPIWTHLAEFYAFQPMAKRQGLEVNICGSQFRRGLMTGSDLRPVKQQPATTFNGII